MSYTTSKNGLNREFLAGVSGVNCFGELFSLGRGVIRFRHLIWGQQMVKCSKADKAAS